MNGLKHTDPLTEALAAVTSRATFAARRWARYRSTNTRTLLRNMAGTTGVKM